MIVTDKLTKVLNYVEVVEIVQRSVMGLDNDCDFAIDEGVSNRCGGCGNLDRSL